MKLYDLTTSTSEDGSRIVSVAGRIADHQATEKQTESIVFQFATDLPTVRNGALLRKELLQKVRDIADRLATDFQHLGESR